MANHTDRSNHLDSNQSNHLDTNQSGRPDTNQSNHPDTNQSDHPDTLPVELTHSEKQQLIHHIEHGKWKPIRQIIRATPPKNLSAPLVNGNNILHLACIKGKTRIIHKLLGLKKAKKIILNVNAYDTNGIPGIHLYYKYGGTDLSFLDGPLACTVDAQHINLITHVIGNLDVLEYLVDQIIAQKCIDQVELTTDQLFGQMARGVGGYRADPARLDRYIRVIKSLYGLVKPLYLLFDAIYWDAREIVGMLIGIGIDTNIYTTRGYTPLALATEMDRVEIALMLLEYNRLHNNSYQMFEYTNQSIKNYEARPVFIAISKANYVIVRMLVEYMTPWINEYAIKYSAPLLFCRETNQIQSTYLHCLVDSLDLDNMTESDGKMVGFFITHTDLNQPNYQGDTPAHRIFARKLWKRFAEYLYTREIDMLVCDSHGKNCYQYVDQDDTAELIGFTQRIVIPLNQKKAHGVDDIKKLLGANQTIGANGQATEAKQYGLFGANAVNNMAYAMYMQNTYNTLYLPQRKYDKEKQDADVFFLELGQYDTSNTQTYINGRVHWMMKIFYSYVPYWITWYDANLYHIDPSLVDILGQHNSTVSVSKQRYVSINIFIITPNSFHANALVYDRLKKEAWRFESYGITDFGSHTATSQMDMTIKGLLESVYGKITYHDPDSFLAGVNFQYITSAYYDERVGDPRGYCLAWSIWFVELVVSNPDKSPYDLVRQLGRQAIDQIVSDDEGTDTEVRSDNYLMDFIRRYAHKLDREKNKLLVSHGIRKYDLYTIVLKDTEYSKIVEMFKVK